MVTKLYKVYACPELHLANEILDISGPFKSTECCLKPALWSHTHRHSMQGPEHSVTSAPPS